MKRFYNIVTSEEIYDTLRPIHIVNCGYELIENRNVHYKRLRPDYYFVMVTSGSATFCLNGKHYELSKGQCFLYKPYEQQEYYLKQKK